MSSILSPFFKCQKTSFFVRFFTPKSPSSHYIFWSLHLSLIYTRNSNFFCILIVKILLKNFELIAIRIQKCVVNTQPTTLFLFKIHLIRWFVEELFHSFKKIFRLAITVKFYFYFLFGSAKQVVPLLVYFNWTPWPFIWPYGRAFLIFICIQL